jgi:hypothetical protein
VRVQILCLSPPLAVPSFHSHLAPGLFFSQPLSRARAKIQFGDPIFALIDLVYFSPVQTNQLSRSMKSFFTFLPLSLSLFFTLSLSLSLSNPHIHTHSKSAAAATAVVQVSAVEEIRHVVRKQDIELQQQQELRDRTMRENVSESRHIALRDRSSSQLAWTSTTLCFAPFSARCRNQTFQSRTAVAGQTQICHPGMLLRLERRINYENNQYFLLLFKDCSVLFHCRICF